MSSSASTDGGESGDEHLDRFDNADAAHDHVEAWEERQRQEREEAVELYGKAASLFSDRVLDTFEIERHGTAIEFYRPVDATNTDLSAIESDNPALAARLEAGSEYLEQFERAQREALEAIGDARSGGGFDADSLQNLHDGALEGTEVMRKALSAFAVDESFHDPRVWQKIFRDDDTISDVFEEFQAEGNVQKKQERRDVLESILSDSGSTS